MRINIFMLGASFALGACSTLTTNDPPVCNGHHRRPANLYGSVLAPTASAAATPTGEANGLPDAETSVDVPAPVMPAPASSPQGGCS